MSRTKEGHLSVSAPNQILLIEDNEDHCQMLAHYLEALQYRVWCGATAREGVALAQQHSPGICMVDLGLPDMTGTDLAAELRAAAPDTCLIAVTGRGQRDSRGVLADGYDACWVKPIDLQKLKLFLASLR